MSSIALVVIDGQNDFCANGSESDGKKGALSVDGASREANAVADLVLRLGSDISSITATMDSHQRNDCSIHTTWKDNQGGNPPPFTIISHDDIKEDRYVPLWESVPWDGKLISSKEWGLIYTKALKDNDRPQLCLWPVHCQVGSWGNNIYPMLHNAYDAWCNKTTKFINYVVKGEFPYAECYSAFGPDIPLANQHETSFNKQLYLHLLNHDKILWTGWAGSHCLRFSALDAIKHSQACKDSSFVNKCIFFEDACAPVTDIPGASYKFTEWRRDFLNEVANLGATVTNTRDFKP
jgi:nicotinamidase/pyrazinamidase